MMVCVLLGIWGLILMIFVMHTKIPSFWEQKNFFKKSTEFRLKRAIEEYVGCFLVYLFQEVFILLLGVLGLLWDAIGSPNTHYWHFFWVRPSEYCTAEFTAIIVCLLLSWSRRYSMKWSSNFDGPQFQQHIPQFFKYDKPLPKYLIHWKLKMPAIFLFWKENR